MIFVSPDRTASSPFFAMPSILTNHCVDTIGSITSPPRCERGTRCVWSSTLSTSPSASMSAHSASRHA